MNNEGLDIALVHAVFLVLTVWALLELVRSRDGLHLQVALFVCALAGSVFILTDVNRGLPGWFTTLGTLAALSEPFFAVRLAQYIYPMHSWLKGAALAAMIALGVLVLWLPAPRPNWFVLAGAVYFVLCNGYAGVLMGKIARASRGVTRWRSLFISPGTLAVAALILLAAWYLVFLPPAMAMTLAPVAVGLLLLMVGAFYLGFMPPRIIVRSWQQLESYDFFAALASEPGIERGPVALEWLTFISKQFVGVARVFIATRSEGAGIWAMATEADAQLPMEIFQRAVETRAAQFISSRQAMEQAGITAMDAPDARALVVIPIVPAHAAARCLVVCLRFRTWFIEDDIALLEKLSAAAGVALDHTELIETHQTQEEKFRRLLESAPDAMIITDSQGRIVLANAQAEKLFGLARQALIGEAIEMLLPEDARGIHTAHRATYFRHPISRPMGAGLELRARRSDGTEFPTEISLSPLETPQGLLVSATIRDITERRRVEEQIRRQSAELEQRVAARTLDLETINSALQDQVAERERIEQALRTSEAHFRVLLENSFDAVSLFDAAGLILYTTPGTTKVLGYTGAEFVGHAIFEFVHAGDIAATQQALEFVLQNPGELVRIEFRLQHKDGGWIWVEAVGSNLLDQPDVGAIVGNYRDITERKRVQQELENANARLYVQVEELREINQELTLLNAFGEALQACENVAEVLRAVEYYLPQLFPRARGAVGLWDGEKNLVHWSVQWGGRAVVSETAAPLAACWALRRGRMFFVGDTARAVVCQHLPEHPPAAYGCIPLMGQGQSLGILHLAFDTAAEMDERKQQLARNVADEMELTLANLRLRESLREQSIRDALTNLYNRRYMQAVLEQEMTKAQRASHQVGVAMIDIDHFKQFNDAFGHDAGDDVLRTLAQVLAQHVRREDTLSRYGGEEFTVIIPNTTRDILIQRAEQWRASVQEIRIFHRGVALPALSISIGLAFYPDDGAAVNELLRAADLALYLAKERGRDRTVLAGEK